MRCRAALAAVAMALLVAAPAAAQDGCEGRACPAEPVAATTTTTTAPPTVGGLIPEVRLADHPSKNYDLGCDEGAWDDWGRKSTCATTGRFFDGARSITVLGIWLLHEVLTFGYDKALAPLVDQIGASTALLAGQWAVGYWALVATCAFGLLLWLRGHAAAALGELALSLITLAVTAVLVANLGGYYRATVALVRDTSLMAVMATDPNPTGDPTQALVGFDRALHQAFVEQPYMALNWGGAAAVKDCGPALDQILAEGPHGNDDRPRVLMATFGTPVDPDRVDTDSSQARQVKAALGWVKAAAAGPVGAVFVDRAGASVPVDQVQGPCAAAAAFNAKPTGDRMAGAALTMFASLLVFFLLLRIGVKQVWRGVRLAGGFMLLPLVLGAAAFPGDARDWAWRWLDRIARDCVHIVGSFMLLGVAIAVMRGLLAVEIADATGQVLVRFGLAVIAAAAANLTMGRALNAAGRAVSGGLGRAAVWSKPASARPAQLASFAAGAQAGVLGAIAAKHQQIGRQITAARTIGSTVRAAGAAVGRAPGLAVSRPYAAARSLVPPAAGRRAVQAPVQSARQRAVQARVFMQNPQLASRAPAAAVLARRAGRRPSARVVAAGGSMTGGRARPALYVETARERRTLASYEDAVGGTMFPSRQAREQWERRTEWRVARLVGQERRPLVEADFDPRVNRDRRQWAIARSHVYHRHLTGQPQPRPQAAPRAPRRRSA